MIHSLENWLLEQGGPAIKLRLSALQDFNKSQNEISSFVSALLDLDDVHSILDKLDGFQTPERDKKTLEHLIHFYKDTCIESFFPLITDLGFKAGIPIFDEKLIPVKNVFQYLYASADEYDYCFNFSLMLYRFFYISGYLFPEAEDFLIKRLNAVHKAASENLLDIYQDESKLPKKPEIWAEIGILKNELNPFKYTAQKPLPTIYDIWSFAYYTQYCSDPEIIQKINDVITYVLNPDFQKIREGYGLLWVESRRMYHACGWSPTLPIFDTDGHLIQSGPFPPLEYLDIMSHFELTHKSQWFQDSLKHLDQFKTERGTYIFPNEYLHKKYIDKAYLNESNLSLKRNERDLRKRELVSTMKMVEIFKNGIKRNKNLRKTD